MDSDSSPPIRVVVLMPLRDDWASAAQLVRMLDQSMSPETCALDVLLVDDGSLQTCCPSQFQSTFNAIKSIRTVRLRRNLGHQRAIAIGLVYVHQHMSFDAVLVMDSDGEDTADGALQLIRAFKSRSDKIAFFAERSRRTESVSYQLFYRAYKMLHRILTGISVRVGNFSILPAAYLNTLVVMSELWNHYAAAVFRSGLPLETVPIPRGHRIQGTSKMNFVSLTAHGISAMSVFGDIVGVRLLWGSMVVSVLVLLGIVAVAAIRVFTDRAIPGWATYSVGVLAIIFIQLITIAATFTFTMLSNRINLSFVPIRDYNLFVAETQEIYVS